MPPIVVLLLIVLLGFKEAWVLNMHFHINRNTKCNYLGQVLSFCLKIKGNVLRKYLRLMSRVSCRIVALFLQK